MKFLFVIFCLLIIPNADFENNNFQISDGKLIWRKISSTNLTKAQIVNSLKLEGNFKNIQEIENSVTAELNDINIDYSALGYSSSSIPIYIRDSRLIAFVTIELKEDKYRVTIKKIRLIQKSSNILSEAGDITELDIFALKKKKTIFQNAFLKKPAEILNHTFESLTSFEQREEKDKW